MRAPGVDPSRDPRVERWAASGAMALTGPPDLPLGPPEGLVEGLARLGSRFPGLDAPALLGERAAAMGLWRRGTVSCGGSCRILPAGEGTHLAVNLPRAEDRDAVAAWLEVEQAPPDGPALWRLVAREVRRRDPAEVLGRAELLGLPVARIGESAGHRGLTRHRLGGAPARPLEGLLVVDLSALWAGPLCASLLAGAGARVVKVEATARPDGARRGPASFFDLLNGSKRSVALDFGSPEGRGALAHLVRRADVVIEASRPRALAQLGLAPEARAVRGARGAHGADGGAGPQVWVSITGYGRGSGGGGTQGPGRVAFGDDAAAAGGLVVRHGDQPLFCADAVADPLTGLAAAAACAEALEAGGRWLLELAMAGVAAGLAGPTLPVPPGTLPAPPRARPATRRAPALGADTAAVLAETGYRP